MLNSIIIPFMSDEKLIEKEISDPEEKDYLLREIPTKDAWRTDLTLLQGIDMREEKNRFHRRKKDQGISLQNYCPWYRPGTGQRSIRHDFNRK